MENKKSNKGLIITIIILILIILLLGAAGYICYDKGVFNFNKQKEEKVTSTTKKSNNITKEEVTKLHDSLIVSDTDLYFSKNVNINTISEEYLLSYILTKYEKEHPQTINFDYYDCYSDDDDDGAHVCTNSKTVSTDELEKNVPFISKEEIDKEIKEFFNTDRTIEAKNNKIYTGENLNTFSIYIDGNFYLITPRMGGDAGGFTNKAKMLNYEQNGDELYIYDKVVNCNIYYKDCFNKSVKDEKNLKNETVLIANTNNSFADGKNKYILDKDFIISSGDNQPIDYDYIFQKYSNIFNTYKTTFKKGTDGKYRWISSEITEQ